MGDGMSTLFEPIVLRGVDIPNRIVLPSMTTRLATAEGAITAELIRYYEARAEGGAGLITVEMCSPAAAGRHRKHELGILHDSFVPGLRELTSRIKAAGARAAIQIGHAGGHTREDVTGVPPVAPSALPHQVQEVDVRTVVPRALTVDGIREVVTAFAEAADRAKRAGFDVVEIHGAHGYLIHSFFSPFSNRRSDAFGGTLEKRMRFPLLVAEAVRALWPEDKPVFYRASCVDNVPGGVVIEDTVELARALRVRGIDLIDCSSSGMSGSLSLSTAKIRPGFQVPYAAAVRKGAGIPTMAVGAILEPRQAEAILQDDDADLIALGRQLMAEPH